MNRVQTMLSASAMALLLSSCSNGVPSASTGHAADNGEPVELIFFSDNNDSEESFNLRFGHALRKKFPHYTITFIQAISGKSKLVDLMTTGQRIDIYYDSVGNFERRMFEYNLQFDMSDLIKLHNIDLGKFEPTVIDAMKTLSGGKMYGLPVFNNGLTLYYNKAIFDKFGVAYPKDGMTWDDVLTLHARLTRVDEGRPYYGLGYTYDHMLRMNAFSLQNVDLKNHTPLIVKESRFKTFYEKIFMETANHDVYKAYVEQAKRAPQVNDFLKDQSTAMFAYLSSFPFILPKELEALDWDMASFPTFKELPGIGSQSYPTYFGLTSVGKHRDEAMEVLKFLTSNEMQVDLSKMGIMTSLKDDSIKKLLGTESQFKGKNFKAMFYNQFAPISPKAPYDANMVSLYIKYIDEMQRDVMDVNSALRTTEEEALQFIADYKVKNNIP